MCHYYLQQIGAAGITITSTDDEKNDDCDHHELDNEDELEQELRIRTEKH